MATKNVKGQVYFCSLAAPVLTLEENDVIKRNLPLLSFGIYPQGVLAL
jgi:hypothetical protein